MAHPHQLNKNRVYIDAHPRIAAGFIVCFKSDFSAVLLGERIPQNKEEKPRKKCFGGCCEFDDVVLPSPDISASEADELTLERVARREFRMETGYDTEKCFMLLQRINLNHQVGPKRKTKGYFVGLLRDDAQPEEVRIEASEMKPPEWAPIANILRGEDNGVKLIPQHQEAGIIAIAHMMELIEESIAADPENLNPITAKLLHGREFLSTEIAFALGSRGLSSLEDYAARISEESRLGLR